VRAITGRLSCSLSRRAAVHGRLVDALAQRAVGERTERRLAAGVLQGDQVLALVAPRLGGVRGRLHLVGGEAVELLRAVHQHGRVDGLLQDVLREGGGQRREFAVELAELVLVRVRQARPGAHEVGVVALQQAQRLGVQPQVFTVAVQRLDALEQRSVQEDRVLVGGQQRRDGLLHFLHLRVGVRRVQVAEHARHTVEELAAALHGDDGVLEARGLGAVGDRLDFRQAVGHALLEGRQVVLVTDQVERRHAIGQRARREEGVLRGVGHRSMDSCVDRSILVASCSAAAAGVSGAGCSPQATTRVAAASASGSAKRRVIGGLRASPGGFRPVKKRTF
jgi:hypothetical protein